PKEVRDVTYLSSGRGRDSAAVVGEQPFPALSVGRHFWRGSGWRLHDHSADDGRNLWPRNSRTIARSNPHRRRRCRGASAMGGGAVAGWHRELFPGLVPAGRPCIAWRNRRFGSSKAAESRVTARPIVRVGSLKTVDAFRAHLKSLDLRIPCDTEILAGAQSPLRAALHSGPFKISNRIAVQPMEGWDGTPDGAPSENTFRRWRRFGRSGGKLVWGGEAVAVCHAGRANPNQLLASSSNKEKLAELRRVLVQEHVRTTGSDDGLLIGLQLTHSGRYCRPNEHGRPEPRILYHHPLLDRRLNLPPDYPLLTDGEIGSIIEDFHRAALMAWQSGFDFVDIKHCHGYLGHEFLSAHTRPGRYGGSFENRTRFLREVI